MNKYVNITVEVLGKFYAIRCLETEQEELKTAADYLSEKMLHVQSLSPLCSLERIILITALNITNQLLQTESMYSSCIHTINKQISQFQIVLEQAISQMKPTADWVIPGALAESID